MLMKQFLEKGKKWADISRFLVTRSESQIKNRFKSLIKKFKLDTFKVSGSSPSTDDQSPEVNENQSTLGLEKRIAQIIISKKIEQEEDYTKNEKFKENENPFYHDTR